MKKMKKALSLLLVFVMVLGMVNFTAFASEDVDVDQDSVVVESTTEVNNPDGDNLDEADTTGGETGSTGTENGEPETPDEGSDDAQTPEEGSDNAEAPDEGSDGAQTPDEGNDGAQTPEGGDDAQTPDEGNDGAQTPDEGSDGAQTPDEGSDDAEAPDEGDDAECEHEYVDGVCTKCEAVCEHEYAEGVCTVCGMAEPEPEVPETVQAFLDAVEALPESVTEENFEEVAELMAVCQETYDALEPEYLEREDVMAAVEKMAGLMEPSDTMDTGVVKIGDTSYETIQAAIDAVEEGSTDTVITLVGDISENITIKGKALTLDLNGYTLTSGVVGQNVVTILDKSTVTIQNGTITGGDYGNRTNQDGKGVLTNNSTVTLENCVIKDNKGYGKQGTTPGYEQSYGGYGGGIYAYKGSLTLTGCTVSDNKAGSEGGGVYGHDSTITINGGTEVVDNTCGGGNVGGAGIAMNGGTLNIDGATISGNVSTGNRRGMAIGLTGANVNASIKNAEISSSYESGDASVIYAQYGSPINLNLENVDIVNKAGTNALYTIYSAVAGTFTAKNCTFHDSNGSIYLTKATEQSYKNCQFLNIDASYRSAYAPVYLAGTGNASFTNCTFTGNKGYYAGGIYNATKGTVTIGGCLFQGNSASNSSSAGAIYAAAGSNTTLTDTVVKENTTSGTNSSGPAGGISVIGSSTKTTTFTMTSGAVYNNKSEKQSSPAHDVYVHSYATANILAAKDMKDGEVDFSNYAWSDLTRTVLENELTQSGNWTATPAAEYVATIGETKYKTLDDAFEAARAQSRQTGKPVTVEVVEGYVPLNTYWGVSQKAADGPYAPSVTFHLNNTNIYGVGITNSFSVGVGSTLTLSGTGTLNKRIYMMGGTLNLDGNVVVSGSAFDFNQGPIYDNKDANTKVNINGDVDKVQIALYSGTVTVGENAHVGTLEAKMTSSSGQILNTNFVMNGQVDNLVLSQCSSKSTATLNGRIGSLTLNLGTEIYGTRTFPTTKAGENFKIAKIDVDGNEVPGELTIAPSLSTATSFDNQTGRTADGLISTVALKDPAQPVENLVLIQGGGDKVTGTRDWTTSHDLSYDGKDYKFLTTVESVDGNIVLHKTVVNGNYVLLDGVYGDNSNNGLSLDKPVKDFKTAKDIAVNHGIDTIHVLNTVTISGEETWEGVKVVSFPTFNGELVKVPAGASLTLKTTLDGQGITRDVPLVENRGTLTIADGAELTGGVNKVIYSPNNGQGLDGGAVYNSNKLIMTGGKIFGNSARTGGGVFSKGTFELSGGEIYRNNGYGGRFSYSYGGSSKVNSAPAGGGVFLANGTMTMTGGKITDNSSSVGGGISLGNETNAYTSYGGPKLTMAGGTIDGNTAGQGGGIFIQKQCEAIISGGFITNNTATGDFSVATGGQFLYGGGGIYVNGNMDGKTPDGKLTMQSPVITNNTASRTGGGIAGCPSANVDLKVDDSGIIAGNTVNGKPYDVYVELGIVIQPGGGQHKGGRFYLSKYMAGGVLYNWTYQSTGERVPMQDVYNFDVKSDRYPDRNGGFYADVDSKVVQAVAAKCKGVVISGNHSASSGGGIGTNGEVNIGKNPDLNDFFEVTVNKNWLNAEGKPLTDEEKAELRQEIQSITVKLERRVVDKNQGPEDNWEPVDSRLILPNEEGFWAMNRPFTRLLKQLNGQSLEYRVVEEATLSEAWKELNGGVIKLVTPPISENNVGSDIEADGTVIKPFNATIALDWQIDGVALTDDQLNDIKSITVKLTDVTSGDDWTKTEMFTTDTPVAYATSNEPVIEITKTEVVLRNLVNGHKYTVVSSFKGAYGLNGKASQVRFDSSSSGHDQAAGTLNNQIQAPSLTLVKKIKGDLEDKTFKFTIEILDTGDKFEKEITVNGKQGELILSAKDLKDANVKAGMKFKIKEEDGNWHTNWAVENQGSDSDSRVAEGTFHYGINTVTFTNYPPSELPIPVTKKISGDTPDTIPSFTFTLGVHKETQGKPGFVMPEDRTLTLNSNDFKDGKEAKGEFQSIKFTETGIYKFTVKEETAGAPTGWTYDTTEWTVVVDVELKDGELEAKISSVDNSISDNKNIIDSEVVFNNEYKAPKPCEMPIPVTKRVNGDMSGIEVPEFTFTLTDANKVVAGYSLPESTTLTLKLASGKESAADQFGAIKFTKAGTYSFKVTETAENVPENWTYDKAEWTVTIKAVLDASNELRVDEVSYEVNGSVADKADGVEFTNTYTPPYTPDPTPHYYYQLITYYITHLADGTIRYDGVNVQQVEVTEGKHNDIYQANEGDAGRYFFSAGDYTEYKDNSYSFIPGYTPEDSKYRDSVHEIKLTEPNTRRNPYTLVMWYERMEIEEEPTPLSTTLTVEKVWEGDGDVQRPASVTVQLMKDGATEGAPIVLSEANEWSYTWIALDAQSTWTVVEVDVPEGYTSSSSTNEDGTVVTITNTYTPTDVPEEEPPKTDIPDEQPPLTDLPDEQPPLAEIPVDWPPLAEIPVEQPPLVEVPENIPQIPAEPEVTVPEEPVPMVGIPQTGDFSMVWYAVAILSALGLAVLTLKKREDEEG